MADPVLDQILQNALSGKTSEPPAPLSLPARSPPSQMRTERETWPSGANRGITKVSYTHDAMIDLLLENPCITQNQLASKFGYTAGWVSQIMASDAFQARLAARANEVIDPTIRASVEERFKAIVLRAQEILLAKLNQAPESISDNLVLRTMEISARAAGYGAKIPVTPVQVNLDVHLEKMGEKLTGLLQRRRASTTLTQEGVPVDG